MVGRICDRLRDHYGRDSVMMDIDSIPYGLDFRKHIKETLKRCDVMLAVIGPGWAALSNDGQSRLVDEADWVRIEIETALAKDIPVIPVLLNGAPMPKVRDLPETMQDLAFRQAAPLDLGRDFHAHMDRLIGVMDELLTISTAAKPAAELRANALPTATAQAPRVGTTSKSKPPIRDGEAVGGLKTKTPHAATSPVKPVTSSSQSSLARLFLPDVARREAQSATLARNWWMVAARGVMTLLLGFFWYLGDNGYLGSLETPVLAALYVNGLLVFLLLDGALAVASGWRGAEPQARFWPLILNGGIDLLLGAWVGLQRLGMVRITTDGTPWPPPQFWVDVGIGFALAGIMLLVAALGLTWRHGRLWLIAAGVTLVTAGWYVLVSANAADYAWVGDVAVSATGAFLLALAWQLFARHRATNQIQT
jgi:uncharacterized membrane protein HdeD (DUF308 family)